MDKIAFHQESWKSVGFKKVIVSEWRKGKYRLNEWPVSKLQKEFIAYTKFYLKWTGKIILLNDYQFFSTCLKFSSPQLIPLILFFFHTPFQDLPNSITRKRQVDKIKFVVSQTFSPYVHRPRGLWTWKTPFPVVGSHTGTG